MSRVAITADLDAVVEFDSVTMRMPRRRRRKGAGGVSDFAVSRVRFDARS